MKFNIKDGRNKLKTQSVKLLSPLAEFKKETIVIIVGTIITAGLGTISAKVMSNFIGAIESKDIQTATKSFQIFGIIIVISYAIGFSKKIIHGYFSSKINIFMDTLYMKKFLLLDNNYVERIGTGNFNSIVRKGVGAWIGIISAIITSGVSAIITIIMAFVLIGIYNDRQTNLIVFGVFILFAKIRFDGYKKIGIFRKIRRDVYIQQDRSFIKIFMSKFEILQDQKNDYEAKKYAQSLPTLQKSYLDGTKQEFIHIDTANILIDIARMTLLFFAGRGVLGNVITISMLILYTYLLNMVISALSNINGLTSTLSEQFIFVEKLRDTFSEGKNIENYENGLGYEHQNGHIELQDINYSVDGNQIFKNFNLTIPGGKITAVVGTSGSGKSTIAKIVAGYLHPDSGHIFIDGYPLDQTMLTSYYDHLGYLTQDPSIFDGTILENITYASSQTIPIEKIHQAIEDAQCEFVYQLPNQLETQVGEKGTLLSGGQRQRLAIAKILLKNPDIIILDEPTSALDSFSEHEISKIFYEKCKGKTIIVIAHRLQTIIEADEIIVLSRPFDESHKQVPAQIIQRGTHAELLNQKGTYTYMYALQAGQQI